MPERYYADEQNDLNQILHVLEDTLSLDAGRMSYFMTIVILAFSKSIVIFILMLRMSFYLLIYDPTTYIMHYTKTTFNRSLRKHAYSNILKILQPKKKENFQIKILIFFIFLLKT